MNNFRRVSMIASALLILIPAAAGCTKEAKVKDSRGITTTQAPITQTALPAISNVKAGGSISFGSYEQDNNLTNGKETIVWKVLTVKGSQALLISEKSLDSYDYTGTGKKYAWENSGLQKWLNNEFLKTAFTSAEQKKIAVAKTVNANNLTDKVFCLSIEEANTYFSDDAARLAESTAYAKSKMSEYDNGRSWWLRSPYKAGDTSPAGVSDDGRIYPSGNGGMVGLSGNGVRPAVWVNL